ncbi:hypothetical protein B0H67DRAFT_239098 [Lasiosphaeris hirsuta]|uniref:Zn(2)-C6 fungal-type domain-containing protein n=1 Tax=Lasiosphaeris hirsuta TaxID=260670 RepID=A0AA40DT95_9PEZI|nr:hypothetical protein B0H67DRAFT_239098 [Lasiosphaeris hirsuta]
MTNQMEPARRKRAFLPKVRTGCLTCKARKIKCDQGKPHCQRCISTGRKCDGYRPPPSSTTPSPSPAPTQTQALFASKAERRSFHYFQTQASQSLGGYFHSSFWGREVLQAAIHHPPIRHLVIALGAAYEVFHDGSVPEHDENVGGMELALRQCNRSIARLGALTTASPGTPQSIETVCCVLTASVLFVYLASVRGHLAEAIGHVRSGMKVLHDFDLSIRHSPSSPSYPVPVSQLRGLLISLYGQLRAMVDDVALETNTTGDILVSHLKPAIIYISIPEAHRHVEALFYNTLAFCQDAAIRPPTSPERLEAVVGRHRELCGVLESSREALDVLSKSYDSELAGPSRQDKGIMVLRLYHLVIAVRLRIDVLRPDQRESAFDGLEDDFDEMLGYCEKLVEAGHGNTPRKPSCSSGLGYVMPLHTIAARCRTPRIRRRAVYLLSAHSRREGLWDGVLAGRIATHAQGMEEDIDNVPDKRIREVKIKFQGDKAALLQFVTVGDWKRGEQGAQQVIEW